MAQSKQRVYRKIRNFAEYRCVKIKHSFKDTRSDEFHELLDHIDMIATNTWTWTRGNFYFASDEDAVMCQLATS